MVTDAVLGFLVDAMTAVVELLPDAGALGLDSTSGIWYGYTALNTWLPLSEVMSMLAAYLAVMGLIYGYLALRTVRNWLPFV